MNMAHGGRIAVLGLPTGDIAIDWTRLITNMLTIRGIYGREMYETWYQMTVMLQSGLDISPVITHRFPYARLRGGVRRRRLRLGRQGDPRLVNGGLAAARTRKGSDGSRQRTSTTGLGASVPQECDRARPRGAAVVLAGHQLHRRQPGAGAGRRPVLRPQPLPGRQLLPRPADHHADDAGLLVHLRPDDGRHPAVGRRLHDRQPCYPSDGRHRVLGLHAARAVPVRRLLRHRLCDHGHHPRPDGCRADRRQPDLHRLGERHRRLEGLAVRARQPGDRHRQPDVPRRLALDAADAERASSCSRWPASSSPR